MLTTLMAKLTLAIFLITMPVLGLLSPAGALAGEPTALDRYVATPDPNYHYTLVKTIPGDGYTAYVLDMTSQQWRTAAEVDKPVWKHWLTIVEPEHVKTSIGVLVIGGGTTDSKPPAHVDRLWTSIAVTTHSVVSELRMVPNEPLRFAGEARSRWEDALVAYSWDQYLRTGDETWPIRLPMTKSAVRAMDTVAAFCGSVPGGPIQVDRFVVGGASKRGWAVWTTAAVDKRVVAVIPVSIDLLNMGPSFDHHYQAYGFWAPSLSNYEDAGIMRWRGTPQLNRLFSIEDPYAYRDRLTMPKFIVNSTGDQYFLPDSSQFYIAGLKGETYLRYVPNTDHSLRGSDAIKTAVAFYETIIDGTPRPRFNWRFERDGSIRVETETKPTEVKLWQAANPMRRDFRLGTIGPAWHSLVLHDQGESVYSGKVATPAQGWVAYFIEMTYPGRGDYPFKFTTGVRVVPDLLPFAPPPKADSNSSNVGIAEAANVDARR